jgi:hypothetical protein
VKPVVMLGVTMVGELPKDVSEEAVTPEARVLPVIEAAGAAMAVLQENPVEVVHIKALAVVLQEGTAWPDGVVAVNAPSRVLAVCVASCALVAWPDMSLKGRLRLSKGSGCCGVSGKEIAGRGRGIGRSDGGTGSPGVAEIAADRGLRSPLAAAVIDKLAVCTWDGLISRQRRRGQKQEEKK